MIPSQGKILIVDDESSIRRALRNALQSMGFEVAEATTGEDALHLIQRTRYDVVLLDINMPGLGGIETCREIRRRPTRLGILMLTVRDSEEDKVQALDAGADDYVTKPFHIREMSASSERSWRATPPIRSTYSRTAMLVIGSRKPYQNGLKSTAI
jgi:two-component system, OmpR family, KDP operon response regulator KdpE